MAKIPKTGFGETVISIGTGSWQVPEHYKYLVKSLKDIGRHAIVPLLGTDDPSMNLDEIGGQMAAAEEQVGAENTIRFGHSSALNYVFREANHVQGIILNAGGVDDKTYKFSTTEAAILPAQRNSEEFERGIIWPERGYLTQIDATTAGRILYSGCSPEHVLWAVSLQRDKVRSVHEPPIGELKTALVLGYIANVFDLAVKPLYQQAIARLIFNIEPDWLPTGHSPHIQEPKMEAELIDTILLRPNPRRFIHSSGSMVTDETA